MEINITTPALLFPAISLLFLAYTNRFLSLASLIRQLHKEFGDRKDDIALRQISNLRKRMDLIKLMQCFGVLSLLFCVFSMITIYFRLAIEGEILFVISLILMIISLFTSFYEILISGDALKIHLEDMEKI